MNFGMCYENKSAYMYVSDLLMIDRFEYIVLTVHELLATSTLYFIIISYSCGTACSLLLVHMNIVGNVKYASSIYNGYIPEVFDNLFKLYSFYGGVET